MKHARNIIFSLFIIYLFFCLNKTNIFIPCAVHSCKLCYKHNFTIQFKLENILLLICNNEFEPWSMSVLNLYTMEWIWEWVRWITKYFFTLQICRTASRLSTAILYARNQLMDIKFAQFASNSRTCFIYKKDAIDPHAYA